MGILADGATMVGEAATGAAAAVGKGISGLINFIMSGFHGGDPIAKGMVDGVTGTADRAVDGVKSVADKGIAMTAQHTIGALESPRTPNVPAVQQPGIFERGGGNGIA